MWLFHDSVSENILGIILEYSSNIPGLGSFNSQVAASFSTFGISGTFNTFGISGTRNSRESPGNVRKLKI